jgi:hypothetical protein
MVCNYLANPLNSTGRNLINWEAKSYTINPTGKQFFNLLNFFTPIHYFHLIDLPSPFHTGVGR